MPPVAASLLERLQTAWVAGQRLVLVFDYDGTLTPLVAHPRLAQLDPTVRAALAQLAALPRVTVGMVSGRGLDDLISMVGLPGLSYGGSTGLELELKGQRFVPDAVSDQKALLDALSSLVQERIGAYSGAWLERKPFGFTVHYRHVALAQHIPLQDQILGLLKPHAAALHILEGPLALEVIPAIDHDKGTALRAIVAASNDGEAVTVLYAGDAANDAPALAVAAELGGIALGIGPGSPASASYQLPHPAALAELLTVLAVALSESPVSHFSGVALGTLSKPF